MGEDGRQYVVKFLSNPQGLRILPNEWWAFRLGRLLGLPVVDGTKVYLTKELTGLPELAEFRLEAGPHYGSRHLVGSTHCTSMEKAARCVNLDMAPLMIVFDHWINNDDRCCSNRNLLIETGAEWRLWLIDHGSCFYGAGWTAKRLDAHAETVTPYWGEVYQRFVPFLDRERPFEAALQRLEALPDHKIARTILTGIPTEWGVTPEEKAALTHHLLTRKPLVRPVVEGLLSP